MLVLARCVGETIQIGDDIRVRVVGVDRGKVRLGIDAPRAVRVMRSELLAQEQAPPAGPADAGPAGTSVR